MYVEKGYVKKGYILGEFDRYSVDVKLYFGKNLRNHTKAKLEFVANFNAQLPPPKQLIPTLFNKPSKELKTTRIIRQEYE